MKVDRSRFLLLTGVLSAATLGVVGTGTGCSVTSSATDGGAATADDGGTADSATTVDAGGDATPSADAAPACLGDTAPATDPDAGDGGDCASTGCAATCAAFATNFRAGVVKAIGQCLLTLPTCEGDPTSCVDEALGKACHDPAATTICAPLVSACASAVGDAGPVLTQSACEALINGLNPTGQATFTSCITEGTPGNCTTDPGYCLSTIKL
jgi:hypothetical protein